MSKPYYFNAAAGVVTAILPRAVRMVSGALRRVTPNTIRMAFIVIIAGSRGYTDYQALATRCDHLLRERGEVVILSGAARGADQLGECYARERGLGLVRMPADWEKDGKSAGYVRNAAMAARADALIAFWDGHSRGTAHMIQLARTKGIPVRVIHSKTA